MVLTDREIQIAIEQNQIVIEPAPKPEMYSSTTVDLTLDPILTVYDDEELGLGITPDPAHPGYDHERAIQKITKQHEISSDGFVLHPKKFILAWTSEYLELPIKSRVAARIEGKSSLARLGVGVHVTAPIIHAGFKGQVRLEMMNHGLFPVRLRTGMKICQLCFETTLGTPVAGYEGRFAGQTAKTKRA